MNTRHLKLDDIADLREYENMRDEFRQRVISLKRVRRLQLGDLMTVVFENRETMLFQIQEMARAERMSTDAQILAELDAYNPLIPGPAELSATLFIELRTPQELREWLPKLVGIEDHVLIRLGSTGDACEVRSQAEISHAMHLTREQITASVHYIRWTFNADQIEAFRSEAVSIVVDHPHYQAETNISEESRASLLGDLEP